MPIVLYIVLYCIFSNLNMVHFLEQFSISVIIVLKPCQFAEVTTLKWITAPACDSSMVHKWKHLKIKKVGEKGGGGLGVS